jgi:Rps23 Pro-64 3,4-dihydroxylase Tpa1-like proline 4-hydroxylase
LGAEACGQLLTYAVSNESQFVPTTVGTDAEVKSSTRKSRRLAELGPFKDLVEQSVAIRVPELIALLGLTPFQPSGFETELVAHEDGAFYKRHIDLFTGAEDRAKVATDRLISVVCYLSEQPTPFSGGELRLYPQFDPAKGAEDDVVDIVPQHGLAVAFSSWLPHEVRPVTCSSREFRHARFAINCWVLR